MASPIAAAVEEMRRTIADVIDEGFRTYDQDETDDASLIESLTDSVLAFTQSHVQGLRAQLATARATNQRLNLRCQQAESLEAELTTERTHAQQAGSRIAELAALVAAQQQVIERLAREALAATAEPFVSRARTLDGMRQANLDAAAAAIQRAESAEAKLAAVEQEIRSLHCREKDGTCGTCIEFSNERHTTYETWPCSTIRELDDALTAPHGPAGQGPTS
jgi:predicted RNase H-like nuclease (RuvC/YqgF family)